MSQTASCNAKLTYLQRYDNKVMRTIIHQVQAENGRGHYQFEQDIWFNISNIIVANSITLDIYILNISYYFMFLLIL